MPQVGHSLRSGSVHHRSLTSGGKSAGVLWRTGEFDGSANQAGNGGRGWLDFPEGLSDPDSVVAD